MSERQFEWSKIGEFPRALWAYKGGKPGREARLTIEVLLDNENHQQLSNAVMHRIRSAENCVQQQETHLSTQAGANERGGNA